MEQYIDQFKALSNKTRLGIMWLLNSVSGSLCVCEITEAIGESHYNISRHLKILKRANLVKEKKVGRWVYFDLVKPSEQFQANLFRALATISPADSSEIIRRLHLRLAMQEANLCVEEVKSDKGKRKVSKTKHR